MSRARLAGAAGRARLGAGRQRVAVAQTSFAGGLNLTATEDALALDELRGAENARITPTGEVTKRGGTQRTTATAAFGAVRGGYTWHRGDGSDIVLWSQDGNVYYRDPAGSATPPWTRLPLTVEPALGVVSNLVPISFAAFRSATRGECVYLADGGRLNVVYDDAGTLTVAVDLAGTPDVGFVWVYNQRLYGISGQDQTLYWSAINDGDSLGVVAAGGGSAVVRTFGDSRLTAGCAVGGANLLFHESGISVFRGLTQDDISISAGTMGLTQDVGTISPRSVVPIEGGAVFVSDRGIYLATEAGVVPVAAPIEGAFAGFDRTDFEEVLGVHDRAHREVWYYLPGQGVYAGSYRLRRPDGSFAWSGPWTGSYTSTSTTALWESVDAEGRPCVLVGGGAGWVRQADAAGIWRDDVHADGLGGAEYDMVVELPRYDFGSPGVEKLMRDLRIVGSLSSTGGGMVADDFLVVAEARESGTAVDHDATPAITPGTGPQVYRVPVAGRGPWLEVTIQFLTARGFTISRIEAEAVALGRRLSSATVPA